MCARSSSKGSAAITGIKDLYPQAHITLLEMDHLSLSSVVLAAKLFISQEIALHGLINNAGIFNTPSQITKDGYEAQWQTNYLAHWVFTSHLLPLMIKTSETLPPGTVRIVNLTSSGHYSAPKGGINFADTSLPDGSGMNRYGQSKLANVLHTKTLHKLYSGAGIWTAAVNPGLVQTNIMDGAEPFPAILRVAFSVSRRMGMAFDADKGAWTSVFCAASPDMREEQSGTYFQRIAEAGWQSAMAKDLALAEKLEEWTQKEMKKQGWVN